MNRNNLLRRLTCLSLLVVPIYSLQSTLLPPRLGHCRSTFTTRYIGINTCQPGNQDIHQSSLFVLYASDVETTDDDIDAFMDELFEESVAASNSTDNTDNTVADAERKGNNNSTNSHFIEGKTAVGIGGNAGFVYDVNKLKRNLVQESVRGSKEELLILLGDGRQREDSSTRNKASENRNQRVVVPPRWKRERDDLIEERLSSLVQVCVSLCFSISSVQEDIIPIKTSFKCLHLITITMHCKRRIQYQLQQIQTFWMESGHLHLQQIQLQPSLTHPGFS